ncbi:hypothetical protein MB27_31290 [Actinoplanes utahensis]|uniref:Uncharacterized protein n=1 Tax=Actinoplanes utahensis TaxID=1869 RepID=A0A0A6X1N9_ACTUT|nr:hypothetical protein MB27_31290 [Actinoplanes utahensis]
MDLLNPSGVTTGLVDGMPFTVFAMTDSAAGLRKVTGTMRTVCLVHLPVALPDLRLRPRLPREEESGPMPAVTREPPWNYDLVVRAVAFDAPEGDGDPREMLIAETEVPGFGEALVTAEVVEASVRAGIIHWRLHGGDLIHVSTPGLGRLLTDAPSTAVVTGLARIARAFPAEALERFRIVPPGAGRAGVTVSARPPVRPRGWWSWSADDGRAAPPARAAG